MKWSNLALSYFATAVLASPKLNTKTQEIVPGAYIIEFEDGQSINLFKRQAEPLFDTRVELDFKLFKGISIQLKDVRSAEENAAQLAALSNVKNIWPVRLLGPPDPEIHWTAEFNASTAGRTPNKQRATSNTTTSYAPHVMTQIDKLHARGITGKGSIIGVIDSGIDYTHPDLGGCFGEGCLVSMGYDFIGDDFRDATIHKPVPDDDPMDCYGHGTHVAGIIAARDNAMGFKGAAPGVTLAAYRVLSCWGGTTDDVLVAAYNRAYEDGVDIISSSLGFISGWSSDPLAVAVGRIVEKGVPCFLSTGNSGDAGLFTTSAAAVGKANTAVASFENTELPVQYYESYYRVDNGARTAFLSQYKEPIVWDGQTRPLWVTSFDTSNTNDACDPLPEDTPDLDDYIVLVHSSDCGWEVQAQNIVERGGRHIIGYGDLHGNKWPSLWLVDGVSAAAVVSRTIAESWVKSTEAGRQVTVEMIFPLEAKMSVIVEPNLESGGAVSPFTSWGPTFEMNAKPQFGAPGGSILSTFPVLAGNYGVLSGTSMACPLAAAAFALIAEARGSRDLELITNLLATTARAQLFYDGTWTDWLAHPSQQGAGLIQVYDAAFATTLIDTPNLSFNDTESFVETRNFTVLNTNDEETSYHITHVPTHSLFALQEDAMTGTSFPIDTSSVHAELAFSHSKITIAARDSATISVTATPPRGINNSRYPLWSGFIAVNGTDGSSLSLSYQGLSGSLRDATPIKEKDAWIASTIFNPLDPLPPNKTFTLPIKVDDPTGLELPELFFILQWGSPKVLAHVVPLTTCLSNSTITVRGIRTIGQIAGFYHAMGSTRAE